MTRSMTTETWLGHSPEVSRKYYLDKFEPGVVSAIDEAEYQKAYQRPKGAKSGGK